MVLLLFFTENRCRMNQTIPVKITFFFASLVLLVALVGCSSIQGGVERNLSLETPSVTSPAPSTSSVLFLDTNRKPNRSFPSEPQVSRVRFVEVNLGLLMDESGQARDVREVTLNLFPDVTYIGVIEEINPEGDGYVWTGYLKDVEFSALFMVYTSGVFIAHYASPLGVYEVSIAEDDLYRVIQINQDNFPGGEG